MLRIYAFLAAAVATAPSYSAAQDAAGQETATETPEVEVVEEIVEVALEPAAEDAGPKISTEADWLKWERMGSSQLSPDGRWAAYSIRRGDGTAELRLRVLATDSTETFEEGRGPVFSKDGQWLAFGIGYSEKERDAAKESKKTLENKLGLFHLVTGEKTEIEGVRSFAFSEDGAYLAMGRYGEKGDDHGADLVIRDLGEELDTHFGRVGSFRWSEFDSWIAMTIDAPDQAGNGLRVFDAATGTQRTLDSAEADYVGMTWREDALDLAVMAKTSYEDEEDATFTVHAWRGLGGDPKSVDYDHLADETFPETLRVVDFDGLRWSEDGDALFFGLKEWKEKPGELSEEASGEAEDEPAPTEPSEKGQRKPLSDEDVDEGKDDSEEKEDAPAPKSMRETLKEAPGVEIWHAKDIRIVPRQKITESSDAKDTIAAALWLGDKKLVQLETELVEDVTILEGSRRGIGFDETPYEEEQRFSATQSDVYAVDVESGAQELLLSRVKYVLPGDPTGRRFLFVREGDLFSFDLESGSEQNLTGGVDAAFIDQENSTLTDEKRPYGVAGWEEDGETVYLYDRFDIWSFDLGGSEPTRLTKGAADSVVHRRVRVEDDRDDDQFVDMESGFYVSLYGDLTKKSGYGRIVGGELTRLLWKDARLSQLSRAADAEVLTFVEEAFDDSPDLFVAGPELKEPKVLTETNAFAKDFAWGTSELVNYESASGVPLQGALFYPADYDPAKTYPMVVYIYELRSQALHQYATPSELNPYNPAVFTQGGYFVFQPDIVYRAQNPGLSAVECVVPAVRKVLESGRVDPERVGLFGHSWGAYQTAFIVTQTDLFAAGVAGAPLTNMMSMSMSIYWNSGETDAYIFHESQGRMDRPFWRDVDTYIANSPIFSIEDLNTPLLVAFGDKDGAVDWQQGIEMYNAARLAQRPFVMLVYPGENHGLREKPNQVDYHHRVREWFSAHLLGEEAPKWITDGESWLDQKEALEAIGKKKGKGKGPKERG